jgi:hypothetical protein
MNHEDIDAKPSGSLNPAEVEEIARLLAHEWCGLDYAWSPENAARGAKAEAQP